jgi:hypothetical protein
VKDEFKMKRETVVACFKALYHICVQLPKTTKIFIQDGLFLEPRFENGTSREFSRSAEHSTATFHRMLV